MPGARCSAISTTYATRPMTPSAIASSSRVSLNENQFGALVSFTYNLGAGNLASSTLLRKLNAGDYAGAAAEFPRWNKAVVRS